MLLFPKLDPVVFSYQVAHGTVRPAPAKSIDGDSPSCAWLKFSDPVNVGLALERPPTVPIPRVVHFPPANERENTWSAGGGAPFVSCWRQIAHGTAGLPAVSAPPTTSALVGSSPFTLIALLIPEARSSFTCPPGGSG